MGIPAGAVAVRRGAIYGQTGVRLTPLNDDLAVITGGGGNLLVHRADGDGLLLEGRTLYVVQNQLNRVAVVDLIGERVTRTIATSFEAAMMEPPRETMPVLRRAVSGT